MTEHKSFKRKFYVLIISKKLRKLKLKPDKSCDVLFAYWKCANIYEYLQITQTRTRIV